jgi:hypothetical protein
VLDGLITKDQARSDYGVVIGTRGEIDRAATLRIRESGATETAERGR